MKFAPTTRIRGARVVERFPEILRLCTGRKVLHLGCSDMPFTLERGDALLHKQLARVTDPDKLWGVDVDEEGIRHLREMGFDHVVCADGEQLDTGLRQENFDILVAGEIIEHVANPGLFLSSLAGVMTENTELLLTTQNATSFKQSVHALLRQEKIHEDHNYYFSYLTIRQLLGKFGLRCTEVYYYQDIEGSGLSRAVDTAARLVSYVSPVLSEGLVVRAKLA